MASWHTAVLSLIDLLKHLVSLSLLSKHLFELLGATSIAELGLQAIDCLFQSTLTVDIVNEFLVNIHNLETVTGVFSLFSSQLVMKGVYRLLKE